MAREKVILTEDKKVTGTTFVPSAKEQEEGKTGKQFFLVTISTNNILELAVSGSIAYPLIDTPAQNEFGTIALLGVAKVVCAEAIEAGERVASNNKGEAQKWLAGQYAVGVALEKSTGAGQIIAISVPAPPKA